MRLMIQSGGTSFLIGLLFGDITGAGAAIFATRSLLDASYSRDAESQADAFAIATMYKLGRSPKPLGEFLFRITGAQSGRSLGILASHPMTEDRRDVDAGCGSADDRAGALDRRRMARAEGDLPRLIQDGKC